MFAIGIRYLCGWAMATHPADRERAEWPPHPDRVFMALAAAHFETGGEFVEYEALKHLSALPPPALDASEHQPRRPVTTFVPVNDDASPLDKNKRPMMAAGSLPIGRNRQPRSFPVAVPDRDTVYLIWADAELPEPSRRALAALCRKVSAVGHSASLVQMWVEEHPPAPTLRPSDHPSAPRRLRVTDPHRLEALQGRFACELRPDIAGWQGYQATRTSEPSFSTTGTLFARDLIVLRRVEGRLLGLESTLALTASLRNTLMSWLRKALGEVAPDWISGHDGPDGPPSQRPHLAFLPLAHVGHAHADGRLLGAAMAVPSAIPDAEQRRCLSSFLVNEKGDLITQQLTLGSLGVWDVQLDDREARPWALRPETWTGVGTGLRADRWASVTPVVLDRYPKAEGDAEQSIRQACRRIGLPDPEEIITTPAPLFVGVPHARRFPPLETGSKGGRRIHTHAVIRFAGPVEGPILIGAGRYRGYGLLRPWREDGR